MEGLGRINLLVGTNNCGKTSVLEAISIAAETGQLFPLWNAVAHRDELNRTDHMVEAEVEHLFHGRELAPGKSFSIRLTNAETVREVVVKVVERGEDEALDMLPLTPLSLQIEWHGVSSFARQIKLHGRGALRAESVSRSSLDPVSLGTVQFIREHTLFQNWVSRLFSEVVLTPEEDMVLEALRSVEPSIERIAVSLDAHASTFVKLADSNKRIPLKSLGGGVSRMLGIALFLAKARGGILLVDEIDTGLHYSVMADMWRLVRDTAKRLDVQVFATTHSRDCYEALAEISRAGVDKDSEVSIQRIEKGKPKAVSFSEREIVIVAEDDIEVR